MKIGMLTASNFGKKLVSLVMDLLSSIPAPTKMQPNLDHSQPETTPMFLQKTLIFLTLKLKVNSDDLGNFGPSIRIKF